MAGHINPARATPRLVSALPCLLSFIALASSLAAQPHGIDERRPNTTLVIEDVPPRAAGQMQLEIAFDAIFFDELMGLFECADGSGRLVAMQRDGRISIFPHRPDANPETDVDLFLDLSDRVEGQEGELGCLGLAFDPDYGTNGRVYVHYNRAVQLGGEFEWDAQSVIARYTNDDPADNDIDRATEEIILEVDQPQIWHNGGTIAFGHDGMLYIALGDGGDDASFDHPAQDTTNLLGAILRIDVDTPPQNPAVMNYVIPPDNPFAGGNGPDPDTREEIFAYGLRNPYRCSFDIMDGTLYCGDVGESRREEISVIRSGENHGWPIMEGSLCFNIPDPDNPLPFCDNSGLTPPIAEQTHDDSIAVIGGHVYYGSAVPELYGMYLYTDFVTGNIWGLRYDGDTVTHEELLVGNSGMVVLSMAQDLAGEVYFLNGGIWALRPAQPTEPVDFPTRLSDIPALLEAGLGRDQTDQGIVPYAPQPALWSDGALKERFMALPGLSEVGYQPDVGWDFPEDSVLVKNFLLPQDFRDPEASARRVETRLLVRDVGQWHGFSYEWNELETDAVLLSGAKRRPFTLIDEEGIAFEYEWAYPSRADCARCHTDAAGGLLGLHTAQMNHDFLYLASGTSANQLRSFEHIGLFADPLPAPPEELPSAPDAFDESMPVAERAQAYLHANCSMCHRPLGPTTSGIDFRWGVALGDRGILDAPPAGETLGIDDARLFAPGDPDRSVIPARMSDLGAHRMPPLASERVDREAVELIREWIRTHGANTARAHWSTYE